MISNMSRKGVKKMPIVGEEKRNPLSHVLSTKVISRVINGRYKKQFRRLSIIFSLVKLARHFFYQSDTLLDAAEVEH
jgi:hypothetical protein